MCNVTLNKEENHGGDYSSNGKHTTYFSTLHFCLIFRLFDNVFQTAANRERIRKLAEGKEVALCDWRWMPQILSIFLLCSLFAANHRQEQRRAQSI